uniref:Uncharacterized protein n=1 Tax=Oryza sativa subsp. japonica TaxID=39947 RepID=Q10C25_ORYSJ|nr:hypothetical protein LOC_Os03g58280 [Oryza sativa Japonica Group]
MANTKNIIGAPRQHMAYFNYMGMLAAEGTYDKIEALLNQDIHPAAGGRGCGAASCSRRRFASCARRRVAGCVASCSRCRVAGRPGDLLPTRPGLPERREGNTLALSEQAEDANIWNHIWIPRRGLLQVRRKALHDEATEIIEAKVRLQSEKIKTTVPKWLPPEEGKQKGEAQTIGQCPMDVYTLGLFATCHCETYSLDERKTHRVVECVCNVGTRVTVR